MMKSQKREFRSVFGHHLKNYIDMRRGMGYKDERKSINLLNFDQYLCEIGYQGPLTQELAWSFATAKDDVSKKESLVRYRAIRHFSDYLAVFDSELQPFITRQLAHSTTRPPAHIYTDKELSCLLLEARQILRSRPIRGTTLHAMIGLAASTGMRSGEVLRLDRKDVNLNTGLINVCCTKFHKDRLVPVHSTTLRVLRDYATLRDAYFRRVSTPAFFVNMWGGRFGESVLALAFCKIAYRVGLRELHGRGPHFHDLRHTFAVKRLIAWYREGKDVQAMLPLLATYMGHVCYSETAYYLTATSELLGLAAERYDAFLKKEGVK